MLEKLYRIFNTYTNSFEEAMVGPGTNRTQSWFHSIDEARKFNCHGIFEDKVTYKIYEYTLDLTSKDADPATKEDYDKYELEQKRREEFNKLTEDEIIHKLVQSVKSCRAQVNKTLSNYKIVGKYNPAKKYVEGNVVTIDNASWICKLNDSIGIAPNKNGSTTEWELITETIPYE